MKAVLCRFEAALFENRRTMSLATMKKTAVTLLAMGAVLLSKGQLVLDNTMTPEQLVQNVLLGGGVNVSNITFNVFSGNQTYITLMPR